MMPKMVPANIPKTTSHLTHNILGNKQNGGIQFHNTDLTPPIIIQIAFKTAIVIAQQLKIIKCASSQFLHALLEKIVTTEKRITSDIAVKTAKSIGASFLFIYGFKVEGCFIPVLYLDHFLETYATSRLM